MALMYFCICMRTVSRNTYHVLYIGTTFGSNARICTICVSECYNSHVLYTNCMKLFCVFMN